MRVGRPEEHNVTEYTSPGLLHTSQDRRLVHTMDEYFGQMCDRRRRVYKHKAELRAGKGLDEEQEWMGIDELFEYPAIVRAALPEDLLMYLVVIGAEDAVFLATELIWNRYKGQPTYAPRIASAVHAMGITGSDADSLEILLLRYVHSSTRAPPADLLPQPTVDTSRPRSAQL